MLLLLKQQLSFVSWQITHSETVAGKTGEKKKGVRELNCDNTQTTLFETKKKRQKKRRERHRQTEGKNLLTCVENRVRRSGCPSSRLL